MSSQMLVPQTVLKAHSERVKVIDMHPKEPLLLCGLYTGIVNLWNYETETLLKSFDTGASCPIRCARFIPRLQSFVCGADDCNIRVFNYNTMEKTKTFKAHDDYLRGIAVHDQLPIILTSSDDATVRQWDWNENWAHKMTYEGHNHFVMAVTFNPKDASTFATASLDQTIKIWSLSSPTPNLQLEGHEDGVNCVEYYPGGDKPYLLSGSDDFTVRLWDYQTKACVRVFDRHTANVTAVLFHPDKPLLFTTAEDDTVVIYSSDTFRLCGSYEYIMGRGWALSSKRHSNAVAIGFDHGVIVVKVGDDKPVFSMDSTGKILVAVGNDVSRITIKGLAGAGGTPIADGDSLSLPSKELGTTESTPTAVSLGPGGQFIAVISEGEYTINSSLSWRPKTYGQAQSFTWGPENGSYAILENSMTVKLFKNFKERTTLRLLEASHTLHGGPLFSVASSSAITFYDWATLSIVRRIEETPKIVAWNDSGELVALVTDSEVYILKLNSEIVNQQLNAQSKIGEDGIEDAFDVADEVDEQVVQATWTGDCLIFVNTAHRLNYYVGGETSTLAVLSRNQYLLGYLTSENRVFCIDKDRNVSSYQLFHNVIEYQTAIVREDFEAAKELLEHIPQSARYKTAQFLQARGHLQLALEVTTDDDHHFDLAILLGELNLAREIAERAPSPARWKEIGYLALTQGYYPLAEEAYRSCGDYNGLLLMYSCTNDAAALSRLGDLAFSKGLANIAFTCFHLVGRHSDCVELLCATQRISDAAFYARVYCHAKLEEVVTKWKNSVAALPRIREAIASPEAYPNLFPDVSRAAHQAHVDPIQHSSPTLDASVEAGKALQRVEQLMGPAVVPPAQVAPPSVAADPAPPPVESPAVAPAVSSAREPTPVQPSKVSDLATPQPPEQGSLSGSSRRLEASHSASANSSAPPVPQWRATSAAADMDALFGDPVAPPHQPAVLSSAPSPPPAASIPVFESFVPQQSPMRPSAMAGSGADASPAPVPQGVSETAGSPQEQLRAPLPSMAKPDDDDGHPRGDHQPSEPAADRAVFSESDEDWG